MKYYHFIFLVLISFYGCGGKDKIEISTISIDREFTVKNSPSQTFDSIVIYNTKRIVTATGDSIFNITTKEDKRKRESADRNKIADSLNPILTHYSYSLNELSDFIITIYDNSGIKLLNLVDGRFSKGIYEVRFEIYSILKPGSYISEVSHQNSDQYFKIIVN